MILDEIDRLLLKAGEGNRSEGIRVVAQFWAASQQAQKENTPEG
jgi:metal-responsive CopG/Arc/MetJ family transcriptional regulator